MAEADAKEEKKDAAGESWWAVFDKVEWAIIGIVLTMAGVRVYHFFAGGNASAFSKWLSVRPDVSGVIDAVRLWLLHTTSSLGAISNGFSVLALIVVVYIGYQYNETRLALRKKFYTSMIVAERITPPSPAPAGAPNIPANLPTGDWGAASASVRQPNPRWKQVLAHIGSDNPSDWRLAILEADIVLEETLDAAGYIGETLGDKLKQAERRPFASLNAAWEAHKIRNAIAHEGQGYELNQREAQRAIALFEAVFREFGTI